MASILHVPGLVGVVFFYFLILGVGILTAWKTKTLTSNNRYDYVVAGRKMGLTLGIATLAGEIQDWPVTIDITRYWIRKNGTGSRCIAILAGEMIDQPQRIYLYLWEDCWPSG